MRYGSCGRYRGPATVRMTKPRGGGAGGPTSKLMLIYSHVQWRVYDRTNGTATLILSRYICIPGSSQWPGKLKTRIDLIECRRCAHRQQKHPRGQLQHPVPCAHVVADKCSPCNAPFFFPPRHLCERLRHRHSSPSCLRQHHGRDYLPPGLRCRQRPQRCQCR